MSKPLLAAALVLGSVLGVAPSCYALDPPRVSAHEPVWSRWIAKELGGAPEASIHDNQGWGRVDILLDRWAIEVDWARPEKATECLDQSLRYAIATGRLPAVILLIGRGDESDERVVAAVVSRFAAEWDLPVLVLDIRDPDPGLRQIRKELQLDAKEGDR